MAQLVQVRKKNNHNEIKRVSIDIARDTKMLTSMGFEVVPGQLSDSDLKADESIKKKESGVVGGEKKPTEEDLIKRIESREAKANAEKPANKTHGHKKEEIVDVELINPLEEAEAKIEEAEFENASDEDKVKALAAEGKERPEICKITGLHWKKVQTILDNLKPQK